MMLNEKTGESSQFRNTFHLDRLIMKLPGD
jgi:hypothetical protein